MITLTRLATVAAVATVMSFGIGGTVAMAASTSSSGVCLNEDASVVDLTHNAMIPGAGWGYDKEAVDAQLAKGNRCGSPATEQSVSMVSASGRLAAAPVRPATSGQVCLNPDAGTIDLTHNAMIPGAGWGYDKEAVDAELAKGNVCGN